MKSKIKSEKDFLDSLTLKAVALKYPEGAPAPFITAIEKGKRAKEVLKIAEMNDIIIVEDSELTDVISFLDVGNAVPPETWEVLAQIFAFVLQKKEKLKRVANGQA